MVRAGDWVLEQMSIYIFSVGPAVHVYIGVCARVCVCVSVGGRKCNGLQERERGTGGAESGSTETE